MQSDIIAVKEYASDLQTFLGSKAIAEEVKKKGEYLTALSEDGFLQQLSLRYNINTKIKDILSTMTTFGSVFIETSPPAVLIKTMKDKQAHIRSDLQHPSVKSINDSDSDRWGSSRDRPREDGRGGWERTSDRDSNFRFRDDRNISWGERKDNWRGGGEGGWRGREGGWRGGGGGWRGGAGGGGGSDDRPKPTWRDRQPDNKEQKSEGGDDV